MASGMAEAAATTTMLLLRAAAVAMKTLAATAMAGAQTTINNQLKAGTTTPLVHPWRPEAGTASTAARDRHTTTMGGATTTTKTTSVGRGQRQGGTIGRCWDSSLLPTAPQSTTAPQSGNNFRSGTGPADNNNGNGDKGSDGNSDNFPTFDLSQTWNFDSLK
jgi:hypothetical protein